MKKNNILRQMGGMDIGMSGDLKDISKLTSEEKRKLLKKMLKENDKKEILSSDTFKGFNYPEEYNNMKTIMENLENIGGESIYFTASEGLNNNLTAINGKQMINFASYNYIGMSGDLTVSQKAKEAIDRYGTSVSASRIASGERLIHRQLEEAISKLLGTEDSLVMVGGYGTNETLIGHIMGQGDLIMFDSLIHSSIQAGCDKSGAVTKPFPHNNWEALGNILKENRHKYRQVLIVIEGVYSMEGDIPNLPEFIGVKKTYDSLLMIDEAHSIGVLGAHGAGIGEYYTVDRSDVEIWMGTLSKAFASCGGYIAGKREFIEFLKFTVPGFVYSVGISPPNAASALTSISLMQEQPERLTILHQRASQFIRLCKSNGFNIGNSRDSAIIPVIIGDTYKCVSLYKKLFDKGIYALPIMYPAVPEKLSRIRFFISSTHTEEQIYYAAEVLRECMTDIVSE